MTKHTAALLLSGASLLFAGCATTADEITSSTEEALAPGQSVQYVTCKSGNREYVACDVDTRGGRIVRVRVDRHLGEDNRCDRDRTFGNGPDYLWVDNGCKAEFEVVYVPHIASERLTCWSHDHRYNRCRSSRIRSIQRIELLEQHSSSSNCVEQSSYGFDDDSVWVNWGCRATFRISGRGDGHDDRPSVELFEKPNFGGGRFLVQRTMSNLEGSGFNERAKSIIVREGTWEICKKKFFQGQCATYGAGSYSDIGELRGEVSSIRRR